MDCCSSGLPPHVGFVFEWIQEIYPELGNKEGPCEET